MAAKKKSAKKTNKKEKRTRFSFFSAMDPDTKSVVLKALGLIVGVFTVFTLVATVSYLFTWSTDQSLLSQPDMLDKNVDVANAAGKAGYSWANFLVARFLGLGSFAFIFILGATAYRLFFWNRSIGLLKTTFIVVSGAFLSSLILAYISMIFTADTCFGGGLGGDAGHAVIAWMSNLCGDIVTALVIVLLVVAWLLFVSGRFAHWLALAGTEEREDETIDVESVMEEDADGDGMTSDEGDILSGYTDDPFVDPSLVEPVSEPDADPMDDIVVALEDVDEPMVEPADEPVIEIADDEPKTAEEGIEIIRNYDPEAVVTEELERIDNRAELERYEFPSIDLLDDYADGQHTVSKEELEINNNRIRATLMNYKIEVMQVTAVVGPTVTLYKVYPAKGVKVAAIRNLHEDIAVALGSGTIRAHTLTDSVGLEVPNMTRSLVPIKSLVSSPEFKESKAELPIAIGSTIEGKTKVFDLAKAPHLLVAGSTNQGKSVGLNVIAASLLYAKRPSELKMIFIDPKGTEFTPYRNLYRHYLAVTTTADSEADEIERSIAVKEKDADMVLRALCLEMKERYELLRQAGSCPNIKTYNQIWH